MDLNKQADAVTRTVKQHNLDSGADGRTVTLSQILDADVNTVWSHITNPDIVKTWFTPVSGQLQQGGRYSLEGNASGIIEHCDAPHDLRLTWEMAGQTSWVTVHLSPAGAAGSDTQTQTRLELSHIAGVSDHWHKFGAGAGGVGWDMSLVGLVGSFQGIKFGEEWFFEEPTRAFLTRCSGLWRAAAVAGGEDPDKAEAAADRTTAFYVPPTEEK